jgi:HEAT repeat protein
VKSLDDPRVEVRRAAATGLGILPWDRASGPKDPSAEAALAKATDPEAKKALEELLARMAEERADDLATPVRDVSNRLARVLIHDRDRSVRGAAAIALGRLARGTDAPLAVRILVADLAKAQPGVREHELLALAISRDPLAFEPCATNALSATAAPTTRAAAVIGLGLLEASAGAPVARRVLETDGNGIVRGYAAVALGLLRDRGSHAAIRRAFDRSKTPDARGQFAIALGLLGDPADSKALVDRLEETGDVGLQWNLVQALRLLGDGSRTEQLLRLAERDEFDNASQAVRALAGILAPGDGAKPALVAAFDHITADDYLLAYVVDP